MVLSGGMDSTTMLYDYADRIALAVTFDYGSNHNAREIACARYNCERLGIELVEVKMDFIGRLFNSSLLERRRRHTRRQLRRRQHALHRGALPQRHHARRSRRTGREPRTPHRNDSQPRGDHAIYPDCRPGFVDAMSRAISEGTYDHITIFAPYTA